MVSVTCCIPRIDILGGLHGLGVQVIVILLAEQFAAISSLFSDYDASFSENHICPENWKMVPPFCYQLQPSSTGRTFSQAQVMCHSLNARLPEFCTWKQMMDYHVKIFHPYQFSWIGLIANESLSFKTQNDFHWINDNCNLTIAIRFDNIPLPASCALADKTAMISDNGCENPYIGSLTTEVVCQMKAMKPKTTRLLPTSETTTLLPASEDVLQKNTTHHDMAKTTDWLLTSETDDKTTIETVPEIESKLEAENISNNELTILSIKQEETAIAIARLMLDQDSNFTEENVNPRRQFFQQCNANGLSCDLETDLEVVSNQAFGICFTVNRPRVFGIDRTNRQSLKLILTPNMTEYMDTSSAGGIKYMVHERSNYPYIDKNGYFAPSGVNVEVVIKKTKLTRDMSKKGIGMDVHEDEGCVRNAQQRLMIKYCNCINYQLVTSDNYSRNLQKDNSTIGLCSMLDYCKMNVERNILMHIPTPEDCAGGTELSMFFVTSSFSRRVQRAGSLNDAISIEFILEDREETRLTQVYSIKANYILTKLAEYTGIFVGLSAIEFTKWIILSCLSLVSMKCCRKNRINDY